MQIFYNLNWGGNGRISVDAVWLLKVSTAAPVNGKSPDDVDIRVVRAGFYTVGCGSPRRDYEPKLSKRMFSGGTPRLSSILRTESSILRTDWVIIGGPHIR